LSRDELVARFSLDGISGGNAVFNPEKLDWFNQQHIMRLPAAEILMRLRSAFDAAGLAHGDRDPAVQARLERVIDLVKPRAKKLADIVLQARPFLAASVEYDEPAVRKHLGSADLRPHLAAWRDAVARVEPFEAAPLESALRAVAQSRAIKAGALIHATRVAVTGQAVSPGLFEVLELVGRDRVVERLAAAEAMIPS